MKKRNLLLPCIITLTLFSLIIHGCDDDESSSSAKKLSYKWTKTMGGTDYESSRGITCDASGNVYITGNFRGSVDFDPGTGIDIHESTDSSYDIFITRVNNDGTYGWTKTMGGTGDDYGFAITCDDSGNVYITGYFEDTVDFDPDGWTDTHDSAGDDDIFITRINSDGSYAWTKTTGGTGSDKGYGVACDSSENIYITGEFYNTVSTRNDIFMICINSDGTSKWIKTMGGSGDGAGNAVTCDESGNVYITGDFEGTVDFDPGTGTDSHSSNSGSHDIFITRFKSDGTYNGTKTMGSTVLDLSNSITCDASGNIYITGHFQLTVDFDPGPGTDEHDSEGLYDIFITRINGDGTYAWTKTIGASNEQSGSAIACDASGNIYITGYFFGTADFNPGPDTDSHTSAGLQDIFITRINSDGTYGWTKTMGGSDNESAHGITCDASGNFYITGSFNDTADFDPGTGTDNHSAVDNSDIYITKFGY